MEYYYTDGKVNYGPFTLEELKQKNITRETRIWYSGLPSWTPASEIAELADIVGPPPAFSTIPNKPFQSTYTIPPKSWLLESILITLFCCLPLGIAGIVYASRVESQFYAGNLEGALKSASNAKTFTLIGLGIGILVAVIWILFMVFVGIDSVNDAGTFNL